MVLHFVVRSPKGVDRQISVYAQELSAQLEVISDFIAANHQLVLAYLVDKGEKRIDLPLEGVNGQSMQDALKSLQTQCQHILDRQ
ncbi:hypothetical protein GCM10027299_43350 [Larkinella ripae]